MKTGCHQAVVRFHDNGARRGRILSGHFRDSLRAGGGSVSDSTQKTSGEGPSEGLVTVSKSSHAVIKVHRIISRAFYQERQFRPRRKFCPDQARGNFQGTTWSSEHLLQQI